GSSQNNIDDKGYWDSGCSRHMTGNIFYLSDFEPFDGGYVSFGQERCKITGKGTNKIVEHFVLPVGNLLLVVRNFLLAVGKFLLPEENFLSTGLFTYECACLLEDVLFGLALFIFVFTGLCEGLSGL
nr:hypothetical protein [Tanacetum cinerariifolium]